MLLSGLRNAGVIIRWNCRAYSTNVKSPPPPPPPPPRPFGTNSKLPPIAAETAEAPASPLIFEQEPLDPARGYAATMRVAREGVLDKRYKPAARRVTAIICAVPVFLVTSWVLYKREVLGEEQKKIPVVKDADIDAAQEPSAPLDGQTGPLGANDGWKT